jgi:hypothetical protein
MRPNGTNDFPFLHQESVAILISFPYQVIFTTPLWLKLAVRF